MPLIKPETTEYCAAIRHITIEAFASSEFGHSGEAELIEQLRRQCDDRLSLIAFDHGQPIGHILFTPVFIHSGHSQLQGMGLGPLSVLPDHQQRGVGSALVTSGLERLKAKS